MDILFATDTNYAYVTKVFVYSICENHRDKQVDFWLTYHNLSKEGIEGLQEVISLFDKKTLHLIDVGEDFQKDIHANFNFPAETFYRILAIDLLPKELHTILYLDVDMIVKGDLTPVFETDLTGHPLAVCEDVAATITMCDVKSGAKVPPEKKYFNAGFLYMNLDYLRENNMAEFLVNRIKKEHQNFPYNDQDILNNTFMDDVIYLPWNLFNMTPVLVFVKKDTMDTDHVVYGNYSQFNAQDDDFKKNYVELTGQYRDNARIVHYISDSKPWKHRNDEMYWIFDPYKHFWLDSEARMLEELADSSQETEPQAAPQIPIPESRFYGFKDVHITNLNNMGGTASLAQAGVVSVARKMGIKEMGISYYHLEPDFYNELNHKLDGIIASLHYGDTVIFQYPSWSGVNYDECFIDKLKSYQGVKLVIFVHDIQKLILNAEQWMLDWEIRNLNKADYFIMPSKKMHEYLISCGLNPDIETFYQKIWEMPGEALYTNHSMVRRFIFTGNYNRFPFLADYHGQTPIEQYQMDQPPRKNDQSFIWKGFCHPAKLMEETAKGGFGLVWSDDPYFGTYYSMNQPHKLGFNLSAGIPVIVRKGCVHEDFVVKNGLGFAVDSIDEADQIVQSISDEEYELLYNNVRRIQSILINGGYTRKLLEDVVIRVLEDGCESLVKDDKPLVDVMNNEDSLTFIKKTHCSVARFGDGEFDVISGRSIPYQDYNPQLAKELREIVGTQSNERLLVCMPDVFEELDRYNDACKSFWQGHLKANKKLYKDCCKADWYGSTNLSRPYMDLADKTQAKGYFERLRELWDNRDLLIVEGINSRSGVGNDLFANAASIERILCPSRNAYSMISLIENEIRLHGQGKLVLLMLGPTAKVISYHLCREGFWLIDLGHIDSEYEWYKMGATTKVKLPNKHTAEHNFDENIVFDEDLEYENQIVSKIETRSR